MLERHIRYRLGFRTAAEVQAERLTLAHILKRKVARPAQAFERRRSSRSRSHEAA